MEKIRENDVIKIEVIYVVQGIVEVSKVRHIRSNEIMCMKKIFVKDVQAASSFQSEFITMASLKHPNILKLRSVILSGSGNMIEYILIFCDFCEEGDLDAFIVKTMNRRAFLPEQTIFNYLKQIISALSYMESHQIAHRDIKPQNIFLTDGGSTLKLGDFGSAAKETSFQYKTLTGTPLYLSPALRREFSMMMMNGVDHNLFKSDVYSLGLTFLYMASLQPVTDLTALNGLEDRIELRIKALPSQYPLVKEILYEMLRFDEKTRPSFSELEIIIDKLTTPRIKGILKSNQKFNNFIFVDSLFGCCGICKKECQESKVYVFNAGLLCFECFEFYQNQRRSRVNQFKMCGIFRIHIQGNDSHDASYDEESESFSCKCVKVFCGICKTVHSKQGSCSEQDRRITIYERLGFLCDNCSSNEYVYDYDASFYISCQNDHYYCSICLRLFNEYKHDVCRFFYKGYQRLI